VSGGWPGSPAPKELGAPGLAVFETWGLSSRPRVRFPPEVGLAHAGAPLKSGFVVFGSGQRNLTTTWLFLGFDNQTRPVHKLSLCPMAQKNPEKSNLTPYSGIFYDNSLFGNILPINPYFSKI